MPEGRFEDAHDVLGTFELVDDSDLRGRVPSGAEDLIELLRSHHALMLARRPAVNPGSFKLRPNRAGATSFVHPDLVEGTLSEGYRDNYLQGLRALSRNGNPQPLSRVLDFAQEYAAAIDGNAMCGWNCPYRARKGCALR